MNDVTLIQGDCLAVLPTLPAGSVNAIVVDPPYKGVLDNAWDNAWANRDEFIAWIESLLDEAYRILRPNGSLFVFAYPSLAAYVEVAIGKRFNVLNHIVWNKTNGGAASRNDKTSLRSFIPLSERIIFAEHYGADNNAKGEAGYIAACDNLRGFVFESLRKYLADEFDALGWKADDLNRICGTASMAGRHFTARSQWCLPTAEHYAKLQAAANDGHLRREYEDLRREYEDLRREYEDLRRPFSITNKDQYSDVWQFNTSASEGTLHPAQKPQALIDYIVKSSTRPGDTVLDFVMGSGTTGVACVRTGRRFIGVELDPGYFAIAQRRIAEAQLQPRLFDEQHPRHETMPLFGEP